MVKRLVNVIISLLVRFADWLRQSVGAGGHPGCVVLAYHSVTEQERRKFADQMDLLVRNAQPVEAGVEVLPEGKKPFAAVTFDDGFQNIVDNALPELSIRNIPATLFIVTEFLGSTRAWEHRGGDDTREQQVMSAEQLKKLPSPLVTIGSHTMTHPFLPAIEPSQLRRELQGSRLKLEETLGQKVKLLSFPYGASNDVIITESKAAGYDRVFTALPHFAFRTPGEFVSGRIGAAPTDWPIEFRLKLAGAYRWLPQAYALKRRIRAAIARKPTRVESQTQKGMA